MPENIVVLIFDEMKIKFMTSIPPMSLDLSLTMFMTNNFNWSTMMETKVGQLLHVGLGDIQR